MALSFQIIHKKPELIFPSKPTQHQIKTISDIDNQEILRNHYHMIMYYKNNPFMKEKDPVNVIRDALAKTLVHYYPYAGRLVEGPDKKFMVDCAEQGVGFLEAEARVTLEQLGDTVRPPCPYPEFLLAGDDGMLGCPLMFVQVTRLMCGGFVLAIRFNHLMSDAVGSLQFVTALSEIAKGISIPSIQPLWQRDLLLTSKNPCMNKTHNKSHRRVYDDKTLVRRSFSFGPEEIKAIRKKLPLEARSSSKFDLISACVWRSRTRALQLNPDDDVWITCAVNVRGENFLDLPVGYYGNAVICPAKASKVRILCESPLGYAIKLVKEARTLLNEEYTRSGINLIATKERAQISSPRNLIVSDASKAGFDEVDFGWGKPIYGGTMYGVTYNNSSTFARYRNSKGEDLMVVPICLPAREMEMFESELRRLMWGPVENLNTSSPVMFLSKL
ncbi:hypothetical protein CASFOL_041882 [Castilleja foliolosa]|uniref:Methanol O-anthraniloyltransferase-like n=1 Tax=Castilleja foliolosa TaxID=1961234 RepID=A0ABD3B8Y5_9LAMI